MIRFTFALCLIGTAAAAAQCGPHDDQAAGLLRAYNEVPIAVGQLDGQAPRMFELFANIGTGTFTVLVTDPSGAACIPASGTKIKAVPPGTPS